MRLVLTGASRGIGLAITHRLEVVGHEVFGMARTFGSDVRDDKLEGWLDNLGAVDGVITCAGVAPAPSAFRDIDDSEWAESLAVNLTHHMRVARWFLRQDRPGPILLIASTAGQRPSPRWAAYAAAKAGLISLGLSLAAEVGELGYRCYVVAPGRCATDLRRTLAPDEDPCSIMQPIEVANVVHTLIGDEAGVLAGQVIEVARRR